MTIKKAETEGFLERLGKRIDNASAWHKRALAVGAIIATVSGACAVISNTVTAALDSHIAKQTQQITAAINTNSEAIGANSQSIENNSRELGNIRKDTLRVQLLEYIYNEPMAVDTILKLAYTYFVEYDGDWIMTDKFKDWAEEYNVRVPFDLTH